MAYKETRMLNVEQICKYELQQKLVADLSVRQFKPEAILCNPISTYDLLSNMRNLQPVFTTDALKVTEVCGGNFYQQNANYNRKFISPVIFFSPRPS